MYISPSLRMASVEAYQELETKRSLSGESGMSRQCSSAPVSPTPTHGHEEFSRNQYVSENLFGNLSLEVGEQLCRCQTEYIYIYSQTPLL